MLKRPVMKRPPSLAGLVSGSTAPATGECISGRQGGTDHAGCILAERTHRRECQRDQRAMCRPSCRDTSRRAGPNRGRYRSASPKTAQRPLAATRLDQVEFWRSKANRAAGPFVGPGRVAHRRLAEQSRHERGPAGTVRLRRAGLRSGLAGRAEKRQCWKIASLVR
jgi:hypothetical protein